MESSIAAFPIWIREGRMMLHVWRKAWSVINPSLITIFQVFPSILNPAD